MKEIISTQEAPAAIGAYSQAVIANGMLFASGQLGINPETGEFAGADFRSQAEQAVKNVAAILKAANTDASHVIKTTVFLTDMSKATGPSIRLPRSFLSTNRASSIASSSVTAWEKKYTPT